MIVIDILATDGVEYVMITMAKHVVKSPRIGLPGYIDGGWDEGVGVPPDFLFCGFFTVSVPNIRIVFVLTIRE